KNFEIKWTKVSNAKLDFYKDLIRYFYLNEDIKFRAIIIPDKSILDHSKFNHSSDDFYYICCYLLFKYDINPGVHKDYFEGHTYNMFLDYKDTKSHKECKNLREYISNKFKYKNVYINNIKTVKSDENEIIQLTDLFIGAIAYKNRELKTSKAKLELISLIEKLSDVDLINTNYNEKMNIFRWKPNKVGADNE
ncbi:MAG: DUF3800 domain-containing protein, partial [Tissierellales bacterium]|nr:DUF3800 domain-containing protein [Tissierellales bacterium]